MSVKGITAEINELDENLKKFDIPEDKGLIK